MNARKYTRLSGQAILELAIFGAIIIMLLGILLNYGLRYSLEQKVMMNTFREALQDTANSVTGGQGSITVIQDKHVPNPADPFGVGTVTPFASSSSVTRSYKLHETPDTYAELPRATFQIQDKKFSYKTAGFRDVDSASGLSKYEEVYGGSNVWAVGSGLRILDSCEGEIMSYDNCKRQCRMITDTDFCVKECNRGKLVGSSTDCTAVCAQEIETPWYCNSLDSVFNFAIATNKPKAMGVQSEYSKQTVVSNILRKQESAGKIATTDTIDWSDTTKRMILYNERVVSPSGAMQPGINIQSTPVETTVGETTTQECQDGVCQ
ncbi:MAG: hypothetical protein WC723_02880 [Candidatus Omnitrophota bacterium]